MNLEYIKKKWKFSILSESSRLKPKHLSLKCFHNRNNLNSLSNIVKCADWGVWINLTSFNPNSLRSLVKRAEGVRLACHDFTISNWAHIIGRILQRQNQHYYQNFVLSTLRNVGASTRFLRKLYFMGERNFGSIFL